MEFFDGSGNIGGSVVVRRVMVGWVTDEGFNSSAGWFLRFFCRAEQRTMGRGIRRCRVEKDAGVGML